LQVDVLTPHYSDYYKDLESPHPTALPTDDQGPIAVKFLAVRPGLKFEFRLRLRMPDGEDAAGKEQNRHLAGRGTDAIRAQLLEWLRRAVTESGVGAKTTAGYGYFTAPPGTRSIRAADEATEVDPAAYAAEFLRPGLAMGELAQRIDEAQTKPEVLQPAIAQRLISLYPREVAIWRKQKDKPAAQKRVAWVERMVNPLPDGRGGEP
jgi:CRISPR-associated protein Cmr6